MTDYLKFINEFDHQPQTVEEIIETDRIIQSARTIAMSNLGKKALILSLVDTAYQSSDTIREQVLRIAGEL